jgi:hypothetical protein
MHGNIIFFLKESHSGQYFGSRGARIRSRNGASVFNQSTGDGFVAQQ